MKRYSTTCSSLLYNIQRLLFHILHVCKNPWFQNKNTTSITYATLIYNVKHNSCFFNITTHDSTKYTTISNITLYLLLYTIMSNMKCYNIQLYQILHVTIYNYIRYYMLLILNYTTLLNITSYYNIKLFQILHGTLYSYIKYNNHVTIIYNYIKYNMLL